MRNFFSIDASDEQLDNQRRDLLKLGAAGVVGTMLPFIGTQNVLAANNTSTWRVAFRHSHTGESFSGVYRVGDKYLPEAFERINYVLRDFRTKEVFPMDPHAIDVLSILQRKTNTKQPYEVLSGYRSPKTNAMLGRKTNGVASNSYHMYGQAMDIRAPGYSTKRLRNLARSLKSGGVGYYPRSNFVHIDTGKVRTWTS